MPATYTLTPRTGQRGTILIVAFVAVFTIAATAASLLHLALVSHRSVDREVRELQAFAAAEAAVAMQTAALVSDAGANLSAQGQLTGTFAGAEYTLEFSTTRSGSAELLTITADAEMGGATSGVAVDLQRSPGSTPEAFLKAIYAGNSSEVSASASTVAPKKLKYNLAFAGGVDALDDKRRFDGDLVDGDVYVAGNIKRRQQARLNGEVKGLGKLRLGRAGGSNHRRVVTSTHVQPPDLQAMNYEQAADIKITPATFGGSAKSSQRTVSSRHPAHIFTMNRNDMRSENGSTRKADFYLEDLADRARGSYGNGISVNSGSNRKVIFVDGNVWIHNKSVIEFKWARGTKVTIVAKGNIYISDDIRYSDRDSMVAFIALSDPAIKKRSETGNIVLGDPRYGTVDFMDGVFYAERNFKDQNLSSAGAATFEIYGGMLAGDRVSVKRGWTNTRAQWVNVPTRGWVYLPKGNYHSEMNVIFDKRLKDAQFEPPPGLPQPPGAAPAGAWTNLSWQRRR